MEFKCVKCGKKYKRGAVKVLWIGFCSQTCQNKVPESLLQETVRKSEEYQHSKLLYKENTPGVKTNEKRPPEPTRDDK